jgi:hypothetical protein
LHSLDDGYYRRYREANGRFDRRCPYCGEPINLPTGNPLEDAIFALMDDAGIAEIVDDGQNVTLTGFFSTSPALYKSWNINSSRLEWQVVHAIHTDVYITSSSLPKGHKWAGPWADTYRANWAALEWILSDEGQQWIGSEAA